jgi:MFS family permease
MSEGSDPEFVLCPDDLIGNANKCSEKDGVYYLLSSCSPDASLPMTRMSAFWTFVPMFLTGAGEILVNPVIYQYVFEHAPRRLRSIVQAMNLVANGAISNAITASMGVLIPEDFNKGHLVYYYYANIGFAVLMLLAYWLIAAFGPAPQPAVGATPTADTPVADGPPSASFGRGSLASGSVLASFMVSVDRGASVAIMPDERVALLLQSRQSRPSAASALSWNPERSNLERERGDDPQTW